MPPAAMEHQKEPCRAQAVFFRQPELARQTLYNLMAIIGLIGSTRTGTGLKVYCDRDTNDCPTDIKISKSEMAALDIRRADFHGDWNYTLLPTAESVAVIS